MGLDTDNIHMDIRNMSDEEFMKLEPFDFEIDAETYEILVHLAGGIDTPQAISQVVHDLIVANISYISPDNNTDESE